MRACAPIRENASRFRDVKIFARLENRTCATSASLNYLETSGRVNKNDAVYVTPERVASQDAKRRSPVNRAELHSRAGCP